MTLLDRYILRSAAVNYLIALAVMMGLYIVLDLFFNMDEFTEENEALGSVLANVASYYGTNLFRYFAQLKISSWVIMPSLVIRSNFTQFDVRLADVLLCGCWAC